MKATTRLSLGLALVLVNLVAAGVCLADPCGLITPEEAAQIMGEKVTGPHPKQVTGMAAGRSCTYRTAVPLAERGGVGTLTITVYDPKTMKESEGFFKSAREYFKKTFKAQKKEKQEEIPGMGERAVWTPGSDALHILANEIYLILRIKDLTEIKGRTLADMHQKVSAHRKRKSLAVADKYILPRLKIK